MKNYISRGKVDVFITYEDFTENNTTIRYNKEIATEYLKYLKENWIPLLLAELRCWVLMELSSRPMAILAKRHLRMQLVSAVGLWVPELLKRLPNR